MDDEENWVITHETPKHIMEARKTLRDLGYNNAFSLALEFNGDVVAAIESVFEKPETKGDKYIPEKPKVDSGMTPEQEEICKRGRWLQDKVNVVFSVAHSKIRNQPESVPEESQTEKQTSQGKVSEKVLSVLKPDFREKIAQQDQKFEMLLKTDS